jgi:hypothetical protein
VVIITDDLHVDVATPLLSLCRIASARRALFFPVSITAAIVNDLVTSLLLRRRILPFHQLLIPTGNLLESSIMEISLLDLGPKLGPHFALAASCTVFNSWIGHAIAMSKWFEFIAKK